MTTYHVPAGEWLITLFNLNSSNYLSGNHIYRAAVPNVIEDIVIEPEISIVEGTVCEVSTPIFVKDIQSFICSNGQCRNNNKVIRFVGFDYYEQLCEVTTEETGGQSEVFKPTDDSGLKCENCRQHIHELPAFRSYLQFKMASVRCDSIFTVDVLLCGDSCSSVRIGMTGSFFGFACKSYELPHELQFLKPHIKSFYFEAYGFLQNTPCKMGASFFPIVDLEMLVELLHFQSVGGANNMIFDVMLCGFDNVLLNRLMCHLELSSRKPLITGKARQFRIPGGKKALISTFAPFGNKPKCVFNSLKSRDPSVSYIIITENEFIAVKESISPVFIAAKLNEEVLCDLILGEWPEVVPLPIPIVQNEPEIGAKAVRSLQQFFVSIRQCQAAEMNHLDLLSKFTKISAIISQRDICLETDAQRAIKLLNWCLQMCTTRPTIPQTETTPFSPSDSFNNSFLL